MPVQTKPSSYLLTFFEPHKVCDTPCHYEFRVHGLWPNTGQYCPTTEKQLFPAGFNPNLIAEGK